MTLCVDSDGSLRGQCVEQARPRLRYDLHGAITGRQIQLTLLFAGTKIEVFKYEAKVTENDQIIGTWRHVSEQSKDDRGQLRYQLKQAQLSSSLTSSLAIPRIRELQPGDYELQGNAQSEANENFLSSLTLHLSSNHTVRGSSFEISGVGLCPLVGKWTERSVSYKLTYGSTVTYKYVGELLENRLVGRWWRVDGTNLPHECGRWDFELQSVRLRSDQPPRHKRVKTAMAA
ncbi:hypothetical protein PINS_up010625 [Pythium insidiosum]|nr:hypothetical protein PINS_up010625 [Pythium insidiosum]